MGSWVCRPCACLRGRGAAPHHTHRQRTRHAAARATFSEERAEARHTHAARLAAAKAAQAVQKRPRTPCHATAVLIAAERAGVHCSRTSSKKMAHRSPRHDSGVCRCTAAPNLWRDGRRGCSRVGKACAGPRRMHEHLHLRLAWRVDCAAERYAAEATTAWPGACWVAGRPRQGMLIHLCAPQLAVGCAAHGQGRRLLDRLQQAPRAVAHADHHRRVHHRSGALAGPGVCDHSPVHEGCRARRQRERGGRKRASGHGSVLMRSAPCFGTAEGPLPPLLSAAYR